MRRLMANDIAYGLVLLAFVAAIVAYVYWPRPPHTIVQERTGPTTVLVEPALTPLQARRARRTSAARSPDSARGSATVPQRRGGAAAPQRHQTAASPQKRVTTNRPKRTTTSPSGSAPSSQQQQPSQPPQSTNPPPSVSVPLPSVCVPPIQVGACP